MNRKRRIGVMVVLAGLLLGSVAWGVTRLGGAPVAGAAPVVRSADPVPVDDNEGGSESAEGAPAPVTAISVEQVREIVSAAYPAAAVRDIEFEREGGRDRYEVLLDNGLEVSLDALTGEILGTEQE